MRVGSLRTTFKATGGPQETRERVWEQSLEQSGASVFGQWCLLRQRGQGG